MISFISQEYNKDLPPFFASVFVSYTNWLWWKGNKYIWDSMILEYIIFIQRLLRRVLLFLIQVNYLHINFSKNKIYVIVICYEKEFLKNISKLFWYNEICITFTTALLPSSLQKESNMNKKTFSGGITFALVVSLSIVTSGCSSNIDDPTDAQNLC